MKKVLFSILCASLLSSGLLHGTDPEITIHYMDGCSSTTLDIDENTTVGDVRRKLIAEHGFLPDTAIIADQKSWSDDTKCFALFGLKVYAGAPPSNK